MCGYAYLLSRIWRSRHSESGQKAEEDGYGECAENVLMCTRGCNPKVEKCCSEKDETRQHVMFTRRHRVYVEVRNEVFDCALSVLKGGATGVQLGRGASFIRGKSCGGVRAPPILFATRMGQSEAR